MPKETVPPRQDGMLIGRDDRNHEIFPVEEVVQTCFSLQECPEAANKHNDVSGGRNVSGGDPRIDFGTCQKEYRVLTTLEGMKDMSLFSPCANSMFPLHINPFEFPKGMKLADHINRLLDVLTVHSSWIRRCRCC